MKSSSNLKQVSNPSEVLSSFRGPLCQYQIVLSVDRNKGLQRRLTVFSQGKRSVLIKYLWGKLLWDELNSEESKLFWSLSEITRDRTIYLGLKALTLAVPRKLLRERLKNGWFLGFQNISRQQYLSIKGRVNFFFKEETVTLRASKPYSGYTKHYKDKGSLGPEREYYLSEVLELNVSLEDDLLLKYLVVGEFPLLGGVVSLP